MTPIFRPGDRVRVRALEPETHCRTPGYLRGRRGVVTRVLGAYPDPGPLAYHRRDPVRLPLYTVDFAYASVWGRDDRGVRLAADLYQTWLEPDPAPTDAA